MPYMLSDDMMCCTVGDVSPVWTKFGVATSNLLCGEAADGVVSS